MPKHEMTEAERRSAQEISAILNAHIASDLRAIEAELDARGVAPHVAARTSNRNDPGVGRSTEWEAEDGWLIGYSTSRIFGGQWDGKFMVTAHKPIGRGARGGRGKVNHWEISYSRAFASRAAAKRRAEALYRQHSPKWAAENPPTQR